MFLEKRARVACRSFAGRDARGGNPKGVEIDATRIFETFRFQYSRRAGLGATPREPNKVQLYIIYFFILFQILMR